MDTSLFSGLHPYCPVAMSWMLPWGYYHLPTPGKIIVQEPTQYTVPETVRGNLDGSCSGALSGRAEVTVWMHLATSGAKREWGTTSQVLFIMTAPLLSPLQLYEEMEPCRAAFSPHCNLSRRRSSVINHCLFFVRGQLDFEDGDYCLFTFTWYFKPKQRTAVGTIDCVMS